MKARTTNRILWGGRCGGFTLIELFVVIAIIGILYTLVVLQVDNLVPKYRLRSAVRDLASTIEVVRTKAIADGITIALGYDLTEHSYTLKIPPDDDPDVPVEHWDPLPKQRLPGGVFFRRILLADNTTHDHGSLHLIFDSEASTGTHIATMQNADGQVLSMKFNAILGTVEYVAGDAEFESYP